MHRKSKTYLSWLAAGLVSLLASTALAQSVRTTDGTVLIDRDATELRILMLPTPVPDPDTLDTALVFHNPLDVQQAIKCVARDAEGEPIGSVLLEVPAGGLRFVLASDIADGLDFIGSALCKSRRAILPSGFIIGSSFSDVNATARSIRRPAHFLMRFPIVVSL